MMKKLLILFLVLAGSTQAAYVASTQAKVLVDGNGNLVGSGSSGLTGVSVTAITGAAATSYFDKLSASALTQDNLLKQLTGTAAVQALDSSIQTLITSMASMINLGLRVTATATPLYVTSTSTNSTVLSSTATTLNVTSSAGANRNYDIAICNNYGGSAIRYVINFSSTAPVDIATRGNYLAATSTTQITGNFAPGSHLHMYSVGTAPTGNDVTTYWYGRGAQTTP